MRRELAWLRQGPKARSTKQKARIQRIEAMREAPVKQGRAQLEMSSVSRRIGKLAIEAEELMVTADGTLDGPVLLMISPTASAQRIASASSVLTAAASPRCWI